MTEPAIFGRDLFGQPIQIGGTGALAQKFTFPPFTVFDARSGEWQDRKQAWIDMGIRSEVGRPENLISYSSVSCMGEKDTSIFDPALCELMYRWFCPERGQVIDPFAGGSVRGIIASVLGRRYWGCDLRREQVEANEKQATELSCDPRPVWVCGDSRTALSDAPDSDFLLTCPPYGDLERYSDDPADLSTLNWTGFSVAYRLILHRAVSRLKLYRFACVVVGNFRDEKTGLYRDLVGETVAAMREAGLGYYNEAVLVTAVGSAAQRAGKIFEAGRKLCKTHQNVLVFCKGNPDTATEALKTAAWLQQRRQAKASEAEP